MGLWYRNLVFPSTTQQSKANFYVVWKNGRAPWSLSIYQRWANAFPHTNGVTRVEHQRFNKMEQAVVYFKAVNPALEPRIVPEGEDSWAQMPAWEVAQLGAAAVPPLAQKKQKPAGVHPQKPPPNAMVRGHQGHVGRNAGTMPPVRAQGEIPCEGAEAATMHRGMGAPCAIMQQHPSPPATTTAGTEQAILQPTTGDRELAHDAAPLLCNQAPGAPHAPAATGALQPQARQAVVAMGVAAQEQQDQNMTAAFLQPRFSLDADMDDDKESSCSSSDRKIEDNEDKIEDVIPERAADFSMLSVQPSAEPTRFLALLNLPPWANASTLRAAVGNVPGLKGVWVGEGGGSLFALQSMNHAIAMRKAHKGTDLGGFVLHFCYATVARDGKAAGLPP